MTRSATCEVCAPQIAMQTAAYPTRVDMCVISDQPAKVQALLDSWTMPHVSVCGTYNKLNASEKYALVWEHRAAIERAYAEGEMCCRNSGGHHPVEHALS